MKSIIQDLIQTNLFTGISEDGTARLLSCLNARTMEYKSDTVVIEEGNKVRMFGVLLSGWGRSYKTDLQGNVITITLLRKGSEIGVLLASRPEQISPVSVAVENGSRALLISYDSLIGSCGRNCPCHRQLIRNYIGIVAEKGLVLHERLDCLLRPSARSKILAYLKKFPPLSDDGTFTVPLDRNAMAEYLNMDRSALSRELSNMKKDGIIDFHKSRFRLY